MLIVHDKFLPLRILIRLSQVAEERGKVILVVGGRHCEIEVVFMEIPNNDPCQVQSRISLCRSHHMARQPHPTRSDAQQSLKC